MTTTDLHEPLRASDADRRNTFAWLREHWLAGRLDVDEYEQRCDEAAAGRYVDDLRRALRGLPTAPAAPAAAAPGPAPSPPSAVTALVLGALSLLGAVLSAGLLFVVTLPVSTLAWSLGRRSRRAGGGAIAVAGEVLGIAATIIGCLAFGACALVVGAA